MDITGTSLKNPVAIAVGVVFVLLLGVYCLNRLPIQLFPDIESPRITIQTTWRAASPKEIESEIIEPIEKVLQGLPGVT